MLGIFVLIGGYFFLFRREALRSYWQEKQAEMEQKYGKSSSQ